MYVREMQVLPQGFPVVQYLQQYVETAVAVMLIVAGWLFT